MLIDRLKPEIRSKRRGQLSKCIVLLHDDARPHTAAHTVEILRKLKFEALAHPRYSPDVAPFRLSAVWSNQGDIKGLVDSPRTKN